MRAAGGEEVEAQVGEFLGDGDDRFFVGVAHGDVDRARWSGRLPPAAIWDLAKAMREGGVDAHDFAGGTHLRAEDDIDAGEIVEGEDGFLDGDVLGRDRLPGEAEFVERFAGHDFGGDAWPSGTPMALLTNGTVRVARGLTSRT